LSLVDIHPVQRELGLLGCCNTHRPDTTVAAVSVGAGLVGAGLVGAGLVGAGQVRAGPFEVGLSGAGVMGRAVLAVEGDQAVTLLRLFVIAVLLLSPWWGSRLWRWWRARAAARRAVRAANSSAEIPTPPEGSLAAVLADLETRIASKQEVIEVSVPSGVTVGGHPADPLIVDAVLADAIRRSGLTVMEDHTTPDGTRLLRCAIGGHLEP